MSKNGYDQFFKQARKAADGAPASPVAQQAQSRSTSQKVDIKTSLKKKKKSAPFPVGALFICLVGAGGALYFFENQDHLLKVISAVEISFFPTASAETKSQGMVSPAETTLTPAVSAEPTGEELNHLMKLVERKKELDSREEELTRVEGELNQQKEELQKKIAELEKMRGSISQMLENRVKTDDQKIETLVQFYSNMKPPQAAKIFETIDEDLAVQILGRMKKKSAADILNLMKAEKAQMFTESFAGYKRSAASTELKPETTSPQAPATEEEPMAQKP